MKYHQLDLEVSEAIGDKTGQSRALGNIGEVHEGKGELQLATDFFDKLLQVANTTNDNVAKTKALASLGE